jgi:aspartate racemase
MKRIGIIGGIGPESTVEYYKRIIYGCYNHSNKKNYPQIFINSINMSEMLNYVANNNYENLINLLVNEIHKLEIIGADYIAIASNTPHIVIDEVKNKTTVPIINIVEETCKYVLKNGLKKVLLTGTLFTMQKNIYKTQFDKCNVECTVPDNDKKAIIHKIIFPNLENGIIIEKDKLYFKKICNKIIKENSIDGIVLGCTELPLLINKNDFDICVIDTMEIHIESILEKIT